MPCLWGLPSLPSLLPSWRSFFPTPGGVGATEAVYVLVLTIPTDGAFADEIAAAAFLVRIFTWLLPIVYGAPALLLFNRRQKAEAT